MAKLHTILQCFVDINLELDEDTGFLVNGVPANSSLPKASFDESSYNVVEGQTVEVSFSLDAPSVSGLEEIEVAIVVNNTDVTDFSTLGETFPKTFGFSAGQQTQVFNLQANSDLFEEDPESFDVIFGSLTNAAPGQYITTTINIVDSTNLKEVFIKEQGGVVNNGNLEFIILEGASRNIFVELESPSTQGVEAVDVQFSNLSAAANDYVYGGTTTLSWAIGEQTKVLEIAASDDDEIEDDEILQIQLVNPVNVNPATHSTATITINDTSPEARYATINLQGTYIQKGDYLPNVQARYIRRNTTVSYSDNTYEMFIRFGDFIEQNWQTFNPPNTSTYAPVCGENCITGYDPQSLPIFQQDSKIFFGKNPDTEEYGDLRLRIKNVGSHPAKISGTTIAVNDSITVDVDEFEYKFKLPANNTLLAAGTFYEGAPLTEDTLTECLYEFTFEIDYDGLNFVLRDSDNSVSGNKEFLLGIFNLVETYNTNDADLPQNQHMLVCEYANVWPFWEENYVWPQTSPHCIAGANFSNQDIPYPTSNTDLQNVYIDGIMFMHQTAQNQNSVSSTKSEHVSFNFWPSGQTATDNGCSSVNVQDPTGAFAPQLQTTSIPFQVIP
jgi:hypothetical protein